MFEMTTEDWEKAWRYLVSIGFSEEKAKSFDGYSCVAIANECFKANKKLTGILPDGTFF